MKRSSKDNEENTGGSLVNQG